MGNTTSGQHLSKYKYRKLATEAFRNGIRLHYDSILLYNNMSYPSALQLSILALEEFSKSDWIEHVYWSAKTNDNGFPSGDVEQKWLKTLYIHTSKHAAFMSGGREYNYRDSFVKALRNGKVDLQKQKATYVGLERVRGKIETKGRVSTPFQVKPEDARKIISVLNDHLIDICDKKKNQEWYFDIEGKDDLLTDELYERLGSWNSRSGLRKASMFKDLLKSKERR